MAKKYGLATACIGGGQGNRCHRGKPACIAGPINFSRHCFPGRTWLPASQSIPLIYTALVYTSLIRAARINTRRDMEIRKGSLRLWADGFRHRAGLRQRRLRRAGLRPARASSTRGLMASKNHWEIRRTTPWKRRHHRPAEIGDSGPPARHTATAKTSPPATSSNRSHHRKRRGEAQKSLCRPSNRSSKRNASSPPTLRRSALPTLDDRHRASEASSACTFSIPCR